MMAGILIIVLIIYCVLCAKIGAIANRKGHRDYFWWAFFVSPLIAILLVIAEPDRNKNEK